MQRKWLGAKSIIVRQVLTSLYARKVVDHIVLLSALMCDAVWIDAARWGAGSWSCEDGMGGGRGRDWLLLLRDPLRTRPAVLPTVVWPRC